MLVRIGDGLRPEDTAPAPKPRPRPDPRLVDIEAETSPPRWRPRVRWTLGALDGRFWVGDADAIGAPTLPFLICSLKELVFAAVLAIAAGGFLAA